MAGIFLIDGMAVNFKDVSISIGDDGRIDGHVDLVVGYDACIEWVKIALGHRRDALKRMNDRRSVWAGDVRPGAEHAVALQDEFNSSIQAVVSAAICLDALYDHLVRQVPVERNVRESWNKNKTARYRQISETIRISFNVKNSEIKLIRNNIKTIFKLRDVAVHPSGLSVSPLKHPELDILTDWKLVIFWGGVADVVVCYVVRLLWDTTRGSKYKSNTLSQFMIGMKARVEALLPDGPPSPESGPVTVNIPMFRR